MADPGETELGRSIAHAEAEHPGESAFHLLPAGADAFIARAAGAEVAQRTLDVQYYIVHDGLTTRILIDRLLQAADRGVRVRLLIDDTASHGNDYNVARISAHPNVEVRLFNALTPGAAVRFGAAWACWATSGLHRRMHNKMWVVDGTVGIVGGRNLGDEYFAAKQGVNFADLDVLAFGPVVRELSVSFDAYWNSQWSIPIEAFVTNPPGSDDLARARRELRRYVASPETQNSDYVRRLRASQFLADLLGRKLPVVWARANAVWDDPDKIGAEGRPDESLLLTTKLRELVGTVERELLLVSPYFVPGEGRVAMLAAQVRRGVQVTVLTNSLEATDVAAVHAGYAPYRADLVRGGVHVYEVRASAGAAKANTDRLLAIGSSSASLHTKSIVFDRNSIFIGSLNLDPRSKLWNTELGIYVESPELAEQGARLFQAGMRPVQSYRLELQGATPDARAAGWYGSQKKMASEESTPPNRRASGAASPPGLPG
jgi:putative cardiolipin synthase